MGEYTVPILMAVSGVVLFLFPNLAQVIGKLVSSWMSRQPGTVPATPVVPPPPVPVPQEPEDHGGGLVIHLDDPDLENLLHLSALLGLRKFLASHAEAVELIDTVLTPAVMQSGAKK